MTRFYQGRTQPDTPAFNEGGEIAHMVVDTLHGELTWDQAEANGHASSLTSCTDTAVFVLEHDHLLVKGPHGDIVHEVGGKDMLNDLWIVASRAASRANTT